MREDTTIPFRNPAFLTGRVERTGTRGRATNHPPGRGSGVGCLSGRTCGRARHAGSVCSGSQRLSAFAGDIDGNRPGASSGPPDAGWERENAEWRERDWHGEEFVYLWADGIYLKVRGVERRCLLLVVGCDTCGRKRFLALEAGSGIMWNSS